MGVRLTLSDAIADRPTDGAQQNGGSGVIWPYRVKDLHWYGKGLPSVVDKVPGLVAVATVGCPVSIERKREKKKRKERKYRYTGEGRDG